MDPVKERHNLPLDSLYPKVFIAAKNYKVTNEGKLNKKAAQTYLALDIIGRKNLLELWVSEAKGLNFQLDVFIELINRGVQAIQIACVDDLKGFSEAINNVFLEQKSIYVLSINQKFSKIH